MLCVKESGRRLAVPERWRWTVGDGYGVVLVIALASADAPLSADLRDLGCFGIVGGGDGCWDMCLRRVGGYCGTARIFYKGDGRCGTEVGSGGSRVVENTKACV